MSQPLPPDSEPQPPTPEPSIRQQAENSTMGGGMQAAQGNKNIQNQGNNNWLGNIFNIFLNQPTSAPVGNHTRQKNQRLLLAEVKHEVTARLKQSLHNAVLINLEMESQPQRVNSLWDVEVKIGSKPPEPLPDTTTILEIFDSEEIAGRLLVLGAPGSGKTTTQLELAQALIKRAEERVDYPIPVLFNLSSWKEEHSIQDWLIAELKSKYGVRKSIGKEWVDNHQLLPMLDGLDEIETTRQEVCVQEINKFLQGEYRPQYLVICSRSEEYGSYEPTLKLNGSIYLQPLNNYKIHQYLLDIECSELWTNLESESSLLDLARTPLLLSTMVLTSHNISIQRLQRLNYRNERLEYLFNDYIDWMLKREIKNLWYFPKKAPTLEKTKRQLVWLAKKLKAESQTEFIIEKMQPSCLQTHADKQMYRIVTWIISGLSIGLISTPVLALLQQRPISWLIFALFNGLIFLLISKLIEPINSLIHKLESNLGEDIQGSVWDILFFLFLFLIIPNYTVAISYITYQFIVYTKGKYRNQKSAAFSGVIISGLCFWIIFVIFRRESNFEMIVLFAALSYGIIGALLSGLNEEIKPVETLKWSWIKAKIGWHQGLIFGSFSGLFLLIILRVIFEISVGGLVFVLILGLTGGLFGALFSGFSGPDIDNHKIPNQGIRKSVVNAGFFILLGALFGTLLGGFVNKLLFNQLVFGIVFGLVCGVILGIFFRSNQGSPGIACIQHFTLRLILYFNGYIPWNYARFLNYATERMFLQRVGGRYRFMHKLLQDHFAQMQLNKSR